MNLFKIGLALFGFYSLFVDLCHASTEFHWAQFPKKPICRALLIGDSTFIAADTCLESLTEESIISFEQFDFIIHPRSIVLGQNFATFKVHPEDFYGLLPGELVKATHPHKTTIEKLKNTFLNGHTGLSREVMHYIENAQKREIEPDSTIRMNRNSHKEKTRSRVLEEARQHIGLIHQGVYDGLDFLNWDWMRSLFYYTTSKNRHEKGELRTISAFKTHPRPIWTNAKGEINYSDWCGVFATYILKKSGLNVYWQLGSIQGEVDITRSFQKNFDLNAINPGDIIIGKGPRWHHAIVEEVELDAQGNIIAFNVIDGNTPGIRKTRLSADFPVAYIKAREIND